MIRIICAHVSARGNQVLGGDGNLCFLFLYTMLFPREGGKNLMLVFVGEVKPYDPATSLAIMKNNNDSAG